MKNDSESSTFTSVSEQDERKVNVNDCKDLKKFENMSQIAVPGIRKQDLNDSLEKQKQDLLEAKCPQLQKIKEDCDALLQEIKPVLYDNEKEVRKSLEFYVKASLEMKNILSTSPGNEDFDAISNSFDIYNESMKQLDEVLKEIQN